MGVFEAPWGSFGQLGVSCAALEVFEASWESLVRGSWWSLGLQNQHLLYQHAKFLVTKLIVTPISVKNNTHTHTLSTSFSFLFSSCSVIFCVVGPLCNAFFFSPRLPNFVVLSFSRGGCCPPRAPGKKAFGPSTKTPKIDERKCRFSSVFCVCFFVRPKALRGVRGAAASPGKTLNHKIW